MNTGKLLPLSHKIPDSPSIHLNDLLISLSRALDYVENEVFGVQDNHSKRVALMSMRICQALGYTQAETLDMASCAILHDNALTKYAVQSRGQATPSIELLHEHCILGEENARHFPFLQDTKGIILHHHENWDGTGFFKRLHKEITPRAAVLRLTDNMDCILLQHFTESKQLLNLIQKHVQDYTKSLYAPFVAEALLDICDISFVQDIENTQIDASLKKYMPDIATPMSLDELLIICKIFSEVTDIKSCFTASHCQGVVRTITQLAKQWKLEPDHTKELMIAAHLHDIGKLTIQASILEKPDRLTPEEFTIMKSHAQGTADLLLSVHGLEKIAIWASDHHEKLNGKGYPRGVADKMLPFESRLLACADIYQALLEDRPYRAGMSHIEAMKILYEMVAGNELDAAIVESMNTLDKD